MYGRSIIMKIKCNLCKNELTEKGALVITPPLPDNTGMDLVYKIHICIDCWNDMWKYMTKLNLLTKVSEIIPCEDTRY